MQINDQFVPHLIVSDGMEALKFYKEVFGADEGHNMMSTEGDKLMHGEIVLDGHKLFLSDWFAPPTAARSIRRRTSAGLAFGSR